ncbi:MULTISPECIES: aminoglycoside phosphotransferase family protein [unclassified Crossiella]|uniref:phosphotransferase n=1 Tax=unclassified Crossiella TaxID=2620835 RepID=UPI001FFE7B4F|nr:MULTISPECIES: aminoglycoside phosphotransferase family protein [unclassified Crossiella]MCK2236955.1 aminoglycoside phosphotransferase family protein [Crossiella sp. S99.2]MCK2250623.1 aminoglycoside phosphotransferase family protein [Crossiella sp. S99.1]
MDEEQLLGAGVTQVARAGDTVRRTASRWTPAVHELLRGLRRAGFTEAPEPLGFDEQGREVLSFVPGEVTDDPRTEAAVVSAARLLRRFHDASATLVDRLPRTGWQFPALEPAEVIVHGDFAPYNLAFAGPDAVGMIDFDTARPGPRWWDIAYGAYRFSPLPDFAHRANLFCTAYGRELAEPELLPGRVVRYLRWLAGLIREQAAAGHPAFSQHLAEGHDLGYLADAERIAGITLC